MQIENPFKVAPRGEDHGSFTFGILSFLLFLLFFRPADLFPPLKVLHLAMIFAIICFGSHLISAASRGVPIFRLTPITRMLCYISLWCLLSVPFAYWQWGALSTFINEWMKMV